MNCVDLQRGALIDPRRLPPEAEAHLATCANCRAHVAHLRRVDEQVLQYMRRPQREGLQQRLMLAPRLQRRRRFRWALAASLLLGLGSATILWDTQRTVPPERWAAAMAEHMLEDPLHQRVPDPEADASFRHALFELGGAEQAKLPKVVRTSLCVIRKQLAIHVVFDVGGERVVVFLMPKRVGTAHLTTHGWGGEVRPMNGGATMAVFARDPAVMQQVAELLANGVRWRHG